MVHSGTGGGLSSLQGFSLTCIEGRMSLGDTGGPGGRRRRPSDVTSLLSTPRSLVKQGREERFWPARRLLTRATIVAARTRSSCKARLARTTTCLLGLTVKSWTSTTRGTSPYSTPWIRQVCVPGSVDTRTHLQAEGRVYFSRAGLSRA